MPARDLYHITVINALQTDGWTITNDPMVLSYGGKDLFVDLGAERTTVAAEKNGRRIAVEIKSFVSASILHDLEEAVGQYSVYESVLSEVDPERQLYLAVPQRVFETLFTEKFGQLILDRMRIRMIVFDHQDERIVKWIR